MSIAVAVSGGRDSLLALARLAPHGAMAVHGLFLDPDPGREERVQNLERVCRQLGVKLHVADLAREFRDMVVEPFVRAYLDGLTPNPCATCNRAVKFGLLARAALDLGADTYVTGHYARMRDTPWGRLPVQGADPQREQSYFLALVPASGFARAAFPMGGMRKSETADELAALGLAPPLDEASREICFVPNDDYRAFLASRGLPLPGPGPVRLPSGEEIGRHKGLWRYTVGQRRGLGIPHAEPLYVLAKDTAANVLVVGPRRFTEAASAMAGEFNFLVPPEQWPSTVQAKTRYRQRPQPARAEVRGSGVEVRFNGSGERAAPGQVMALYHADGLLLGGGVVTEGA